jgi:shikimate dehydrogenase
MDQVSYISGETRIFAIVGHPIEQVRSPEMITAEMVRRGRNAILVPLDIRPADFEDCVRQLLRIRNLDGLIFTIPFKQSARMFADALGAQARIVGAINALARNAERGWIGDIFDGVGCVAAFRNRGYSFAERRVMLVGAGGAGRAIAVAVAHEGPRAMRIFDIDAARCMQLVADVSQLDPAIDVKFAVPTLEDIDILVNASPLGMLGNPGMPVEVGEIPAEIIVFDAIVKPEETALLKVARACGCRTVSGREMMLGQIRKVVDHFETQNGVPAPDAR